MTLKQDIYGVPTTSGMANVGDHTGIVTYFNTPQSGLNANYSTLNQTSLIKWAAVGRYSKIVEGQTSGLTAGAKSRCYAVVDVMRNFSAFDLTDSALSGVIVTMVSDGTLTSGDMNAFNKLLVKSPASLAESLYGRFITLDEVSSALRI